MSVPEFDICISFAGSVRTQAETLRTRLVEQGFVVFYDADFADLTWGANLPELFDQIYNKRSSKMIALVNEDYINRAYTILERQFGLARRLTGDPNYFLTVKVSEIDVEIPGYPNTYGYLSWVLNRESADRDLDRIVNALVKKFNLPVLIAEPARGPLLVREYERLKTVVSILSSPQNSMFVAKNFVVYNNNSARITLEQMLDLAVLPTMPNYDATIEFATLQTDSPAWSDTLIDKIKELSVLCGQHNASQRSTTTHSVIYMDCDVSSLSLSLMCLRYNSVGALFAVENYWHYRDGNGFSDVAIADHNRAEYLLNQPGTKMGIVDATDLLSDVQEEKIEEPDVTQVTVCKQWLRENLRITKVINYSSTSYGMKHSVEDAMRAHGTGMYISNDAFKVALLTQGYSLLRSDSRSPNFYANWARLD